jgi:hypothetical protein
MIFDCFAFVLMMMGMRIVEGNFDKDVFVDEGGIKMAVC